MTPTLSTNRDPLYRLASWSGTTSGAYSHDAVGCVTFIVASAGLRGGARNDRGRRRDAKPE